MYQNQNQFCRCGPSLLWAEFVWDDLVMGRVCNGPSLLWAEMSSYRISVCLFALPPRNTTVIFSYFEKLREILNMHFKDDLISKIHAKNYSII